MPRYSRPLDPFAAAAELGRRPGNYVIRYDDGSAYVGRQGRTSNRLATHVRNSPGEVLAVHFMHDGEDDICVRARREAQTISTLLDAGIPLRNQIEAARPYACPVEDRGQRRRR